MSSLDRFAEAFDNIRASFKAGRLAHAHLITGSPRGQGLEFAESMVRLVLENEDADVHQHPDVIWLEPEKKSRVIGIEQIREANKLVSQKSFTGGWKSVVFLFADRLNDNAANGLLKTLEEPSAKTLLLLVTDSPQGLLPTIASRCQRIDLGGGQAVPTGPWLAELLDILRTRSAGALEQVVLAARVKGILDAEKKRITAEEEGDEVDKEVLEARVEAKVKQVRSDLLQVLTLWHRDLLFLNQGGDGDLLMFPAEEKFLRQQAEKQSFSTCVAALKALEDTSRRMDRNLPDTLAMEAFAFTSSLF